MQQAVFKQYSGSAGCARRLPRMASLVGVVAATALAFGALGWFALSNHVPTISSEQQMRSSGLTAAWAEGSVLVLIRHAERCDRSSNVCLNDPTGITVAGSQAAGGVGEGLQRLGLANTALLSSTELRTRQTAQFIFNKPLATQQWLNDCDGHFADVALSHKQPGQNLALVTHSGCIDQLERQLHVPGGQRSSAYASALFVAVDGHGKPHILGQTNAEQWPRLIAKRGS